MSSTRSDVRRRVRPLLLLLPFLFFVAAMGHLLRRPRPGEPAAPPSSTDPESHVEAWRGELLGAHGGWLEATLTPLHPDRERRDFESHTLARRLGLEPGQAWRLRVRWGAPGALGSRGPGGAESLPRAQPAGIGLGELEVADSTGTALRSLRAPEPGPGAADPLRVLAGPPSGSLRPGQAADWILWGRSPLEGPRLIGLVPEGDPEFHEATGFAGPFELRVVSLRRGDLDEPLARLERPAQEPRKTAAGASSDAARSQGHER
ncbi:MAG TPA: hypothetical protein VMT18_16130 [Planctomycetota bacterium]|nr:hypothetical protein [Planctomycetota bacterium]